MRRRYLTAAQALIAAAAAALPTTAAAKHDRNLHSPNLSLEANVPTGPGGDIAFWGDTAVLAHGATDGDPGNDGFRLLDIARPDRPREIGRFTCPAAGYDVGVWDKLVFLSVNRPVSGASCTPGQGDDATFAGIQIVSVEDPGKPRQVASVTVCPDNPVGTGSHTHTVLPDLDHRAPDGRHEPRVLLYSSSTCTVVIEVPLHDPAAARVVAEIATEPLSLGCHDVTVLVAHRLAACTGITATILWDVSDPEAPRTVSQIVNPAITHHHSATFSNDGATMVLSDEGLVSAATTSCFGGTGSPVGAMWFYDVRDPARPELRGYYQLPRGAAQYCAAHQANVVPLRGERDILVAAWYRGGTTVVDFTDPGAPREVAHFLGAPGDPEMASMAWSSYWYNGRIYSNNLDLEDSPVPVNSLRGLDVLRLDDPAVAGAVRLPHLNAQTQEPLPAPPRPQDPRTRAEDVTPGVTVRRECSSRRRVTVTVRVPRRTAIRAATARVAGRRVPVRLARGRRAAIARVDLRGLPRGRYKVRLRIRRVDGRVHVVHRRFRTCARRR